MARLSCTIHQLWQGAGMLCPLLLDAARFLRLCLRPRAALVAENLFLRRQLVVYPYAAATPTVSLDVISLVASSCGYYRGHIEPHAAQ
jgi:hypothetical protein